MGCNMQRQAVPLLRPEAPLVGTGHGAITAQRLGRGRRLPARRASSTTVDAHAHHRPRRRRGTARRRREDFGADIYNLTKFKRSNQNTCINQKPIVHERAARREGARSWPTGPAPTGASWRSGATCWSRFMPWRGYNFEDAILVSEKLVKDDYFTSIHIEEFEIEARDTKLGPEEITRDIPNVSEEFLNDLDESGSSGSARTSSRATSSSGKVTPKGETQLTPEEKLLRAIFGEKSGDVRDASLTTPPGIEGTVVDVKIFCRKGVEKDSRAQAIEDDDDLADAEEPQRRGPHPREENAQEDHGPARRARDRSRRAAPREDGRSASRRDRPRPGADGQARHGGPDPRRDPSPRSGESSRRSATIEERTEKKIQILRSSTRRRSQQLRKGRRAAARRHQDGQGLRRHEAQAARSATRWPAATATRASSPSILPDEDMPYLPDGTPVEIVLNPLGVPSPHERRPDPRDPPRLGRARLLGLHFATPVFDGATRGGDQGRSSPAGRACPTSGKIDAVRRHDRRGVRAEGHRRLHLHAEALAPGRRQDPRPLDRTVLADHAAAARAARRSSAASGSERWKSGRSRRTARPTSSRSCSPRSPTTSTAAPRSTKRSSRARRAFEPGSARVVQRPGPGAAEPVPRRRAAEDEAREPDDRSRSRIAATLTKEASRLNRDSLFFDRARTINDFDAHPDQPGLARRRSGPGRTARSRSRRRSTTAPSSRSGTACSARRSSAPSPTGSACAAKFKRMKHRGVVCDKCGVEVTQSKVRRERMGHIELASPGQPRLVLQGAAEPHRAPARHHACATSSGSSTSRRTSSSTPATPGARSEQELLDARTATASCATSPATGSRRKMGAEAIKELLQQVDVESAGASSCATR